MFTNSCQPYGFTHPYRNICANAIIMPYCQYQKTICQKQVNSLIFKSKLHESKNKIPGMFFSIEKRKG